MKRAVVLVLSVAVVASATGVGLFLHGRAAKAAATTLPDDTFITPSIRKDLSQIVSATGPVASNLDVRSNAAPMAKSSQLPFDISDTVKKGDLLVQLDTKDEEVILDQAKVTLAAIQFEAEGSGGKRAHRRAGPADRHRAGGCQYRLRQHQGDQPSRKKPTGRSNC